MAKWCFLGRHQWPLKSTPQMIKHLFLCRKHMVGKEQPWHCTWLHPALCLHCAVLEVFKIWLEPVLGNLIWIQGGWTRWFPVVPATFPSHLCHSTDFTVPGDANKSVQSFYRDLLSSDVGRATLSNFAVALNAPHIWDRVCQFDREHLSWLSLWWSKF